MKEYTGDDLLLVFEDLNIQLGDVSPNAVRAWFDNNEEDMKEMLNWMCSSLSKENHISSQEYLEYTEIAEPLIDVKYEKELSNIENVYPGLFDVENNKTEIEFLEDEYELLREENANCDTVLKMQQDLKLKFTSELSEANSNFIQSSLQLKESYDKCINHSVQLDNLHEELLKQLRRYGRNLQEFKFGHFPNFLNSMDLNSLQENIDGLSPYLNVLMKNTFLNSSDLTGEFTMKEDEISVMLSDIQSRIYNSHQEYLANKVEEGKLKAVLNYILKQNAENICSLSESVHLQANIDAKTESKNMMCKMMENVSDKYATICINQPKLRYQQQELNNSEQRLTKLNSVLTCIYKLLSYYIVLYNLFKSEGKDIQGTESFFKKLLDYISKDLEICQARIEKMNTIIDDYDLYTKNPLDEKFKFVQSIGKILSKNKTSLTSILQTVNDFKMKLCNLEEQVFVRDFEEHCQYSRDMEKNMDNLEQFLTSGSTNRIVGISSELYRAIKEVNTLVKNQTSSVQDATRLSSKMKKIQDDKWKNHLRQLWMYFLKDSPKLFFVLQELEEESKNTIKQ
ncbi:unnamed protein product [Brassicogethes aeneus]|uniref:HAUS augmin-like complex subunit 3 N-terminal domain-containing protein n=1 Tax=Brassicogethes aeneus TaxID=1431903 RepID=A0A9P0AY45_BRAAE|nr:unnamed protein product [Brassicogethes aeneus]